MLPVEITNSNFVMTRKLIRVNNAMDLSKSCICARFSAVYHYTNTLILKIGQFFLKI